MKCLVIYQVNKYIYVHNFITCCLYYHHGLFDFLTAFEFVIAQSPYNLRGFMIGILYAVQGIFALVAVLLVVPFTNTSEKHINCPPGYYSLLIVLSVSLFIVYLIITRRYQRRERGPIVNERQMIETNFEHMFDLRDSYHKEQNE